MTTHIMKQVATRLNRSQEQLPDGFHISFNISAAHCHDFALLAECRAFLGHFLPGKVVLVLELTERELLMSDPQTLSLFRQLDEMGVKLAIDDFGTGHSSLAYLQQFHVDYLKIRQILYRPHRYRVALGTYRGQRDRSGDPARSGAGGGRGGERASG